MKRSQRLDYLLAQPSPARDAWIAAVIEAGRNEGIDYSAEEIVARLEPTAAEISSRLDRVIKLLKIAIVLPVAFWLLYWLHQWIGFWDLDLDLEVWVYPLNILVPIVFIAFGWLWYSRTRSA